MTEYCGYDERALIVGPTTAILGNGVKFRIPTSPVHECGEIVLDIDSVDIALSPLDGQRTCTIKLSRDGLIVLRDALIGASLEGHAYDPEMHQAAIERACRILSE